VAQSSKHVNRLAIALALLFLAGAALLSWNWNRLLAAWHQQCYKSAMQRFDAGSPTNPLGPAMALSRRLLGVPSENLADDLKRATYHWSELLRLGGAERREFRVGNWADGDRFKNYADYPFNGARLSKLEDLGRLEMLRGAAFSRQITDAKLYAQWSLWLPPGADFDSVYQPTLIVQDAKERMPLWEAFVARHNEEAALKK
jgi:hypothetical protein